MHSSVWKPYLSDAGLRALALWRSGGGRTIRAIRAVVVDAASGRLSLWAMSLVYTTLLSIVPLLAVCFSVLKGFGVHNQIEPVLAGFLAPMGARGEEITRNVIGFVENVQVGVLGSAGFVFLFYTVLSLVQKVERAFNEIWLAAEPRPLIQRVSSYLSVLLVGPVFVVTILGMTASAASSDTVHWLMGIRAVGPAVGLASKLAPYVIVIGAFTLAYLWIPNTRVKLSSALMGALFAGLAWETAGLGFASFVASSGRYDAIYSGFAILVFFMIWTYLSWLILLAGASLAFHHQHPDEPIERGVSDHWGIARLGLQLVARIAQRFQAGEPQETLADMAQRLQASEDEVREVLARLTAAHLLVESVSEPRVYVPSRAPASIGAGEILAVLGSRPAPAEPRSLPADAPDRILSRVDRAIDAALDGLTMADLDEPSSDAVEKG